MRFLILVALIILMPTAAFGDGQTLVRSTSPYWAVGKPDSSLGRLCGIGKFNEADIDRYVARFTGPTGAAVLGVAKGTGLNLHDPEHKAVRTEDYFFYQDGSSSCAVYVGGRK